MPISLFGILDQCNFHCIPGGAGRFGLRGPQVDYKSTLCFSGRQQFGKFANQFVVELIILIVNDFIGIGKT